MGWGWEWYTKYLYFSCNDFCILVIMHKETAIYHFTEGEKMAVLLCTFHKS